MKMLKGLDVSHHDGPIDWKKVAKAGAAFAIIKASEGTTFTDPLYHSNVRGALAAGLRVSSYHYFKATREAWNQLQHFLHVVGDLKGQLVPALDVEEHGDLSPADYSKSVRAWLDGFEQLHGRKAILYTYPDFNAHALQHTFGDHPLWVASYPKAGLKGKPAQLAGWTSWTFWQYTDHGTWPGVPGTKSTDLDVFAGEAAELDKLLMGQ